MKDSEWWKPALFIPPLFACGWLSTVDWTAGNMFAGIALLVVIGLALIGAFVSQTSTSAQEPYWTPKITGARLVDNQFLEFDVSASNIQHVGRNLNLPSWGTEITQVTRNKMYLVRVEAPLDPLTHASQQDAARWYLQDWARANGVEITERK